MHSLLRVLAGWDARWVWQQIERGEFPQPVRGPWGSAWRVADIPAHLTK